MDDFGRAHVLDELLDYGIACEAEFLDAALEVAAPVPGDHSAKNSWILRRERREA